MVVGNNKFEAVREALIPVHVEILVADEQNIHVGRLIHTVKKRTRCDFQNMIYNK